MVFWGDHTGLPRSYKGWDVFIGGEQNGTKKLLEWLRDYMSVDTVTLLLPVENQQNLAVYATLGLEEEIVQQIRIPIGRGIAGRIAALQKPMIVNNLSAVEVVSPILRQKGLRSLVGIPLTIKKGVTGVLHVGTFGSRQFTDLDVQQLQMVAHRLESAMAEAELVKFEWGSHNQESCLEIFSFKKRTPWVNTLDRVFTLNLSVLRARVLKVARSLTSPELFMFNRGRVEKFCTKLIDNPV